MQRSNILKLLILICFTMPATASAGDFDWLKDLDKQAKTDLSDFRVTIGTRFRIGDAQVKLVFSNVDKPADSYMVLRLSELSHRSVNDVLKVYKADHDKGWGIIAKHLGIKPGSREFHALKRGHDLAREEHRHEYKHGMKDKGNSKHKG